ncbi:hypothetical protein T08_9151 [Trichinella sp. T8]|nr:hypothetical protein T08_9151 [Trichinella sp. T8]
MYKNLNVLHHQHRALSYSCVSLSWLHGVTQYCSKNLCDFAYRNKYYVSSTLVLQIFSESNYV